MFSDIQRTRLESFQQAAEMVGEVFDPMSAWGASSLGIAEVVKDSLDGECREQLPQSADADHARPA
jgi:hypothetical protein